MSEQIATEIESVLNPYTWKELLEKCKAQKDFLSGKTLTVILNGVEELAKARSVPNPSIRVSSIHLSTFQDLLKAFNNPRLLKQVGTLYLHEFALPEVALDHLDLALQLSSGQKDPQIEALREAAIGRMSRSGDRDLHSTVDQPLRQKPIVSTVVRKTGRLTLSNATQQLKGTFKRLSQSANASVTGDRNETPDSASLDAKASGLLQAGQWREALPCLDAARTRQVSVLVLQKLYTQAGLMALAEGDFNLALEACVKARDVFPVKADPWTNVGVVYQKLGRLDEALACFVQAQQIETKSPEAWCNLSSVQFERGVFTEAEKAARNALQLSPEHAVSWDALAAALAAADRLPEAAEACSQAIRYNPELSSAWFKLGTIEFQLDNLGKARDAFTRAQNNPEFAPFALYYQAMIHARRGEFKAAQVKLASARANAPSSELLLVVLREMGLSFAQRNDLTQALKFYSEAIAVQSNDFASWLGIGTIHHRQGQMGEARQAYLQAASLQLNHPGPWHNLGLLAAEEGYHAEEQTCFEKVIELSPENPKAWYDLGVSFQHQGRQEESQQAFAKAEELIEEPAGVSGDLLVGLRMVRRMHLKKRAYQVK